MNEPVAVRVRDCACPGQPHGEEGDVVFLAATPSLALGLAAERDNATSIQEAVKAAPPPPWTDAQTSAVSADAAERLRQRWLVTYVKHGAVGWNLVDERGPVPFDVAAILADYGIARPVAEKADELYGDTVTAPLVRRLSSISQRGPTAALTSRRNGSTLPPQRRSSRSTTAASARSHV